MGHQDITWNPSTLTINHGQWDIKISPGILLTLTATNSRSMRLSWRPGTPTANPLSEYLISLAESESHWFEGNSIQEDQVHPCSPDSCTLSRTALLVLLAPVLVVGPPDAQVHDVDLCVDGTLAASSEVHLPAIIGCANSMPDVRLQASRTGDGP